MDSRSAVIRKRKVSRLFGDVDERKFAIPHLQREFVWDGPKAAKLLDSILQGFPVGVVLVWETPRTQRLYLREKYHVLPAFDAHNHSVWFLIDGQQRVSVLHHARQGDILENARRRSIDFSRVVLSLRKEEDGQQIRYRRAMDGGYISLSVVLHPHWKQKLKGLGTRNRERVQDCRSRILNYPLPVMFIHGGISEIRECFLRINTQGMKVTTADAIFTRAETLDLRDVVHEVRGHLDDAFKDVPDAPILFLLAAIRGGTDARGRSVDATIRRLTREANDARFRKSLAKDWNRLGPCVGKAADYLREHFCAITREYLASDYMLSILSYFFFVNGRGPNARQATEIRKWFWATSVGSRYSGRDFNRSVPADLRFFRELATKPARRFIYTPQVERVDVRKAQYAAKTAITSAVYCVLLKRHPVSFLDDGLNPIPVQRYSTPANRKDRHHIFPRQVLANLGVPAKLYNSISNICLLVAEENQRIGSKVPRRYLGKLKSDGSWFQRKMDRHLIPANASSGIWNHGVKRGFGSFIRERTEVICQALEEQAGIRLFVTEKDGK